MATRDEVHRISIVNSLAQTPLTNGNAATNGVSVDTQGYEGVTLIARVGARTDGTYTFKIQDSPDNATWTDLPANQVIGGVNGTGALGAANSIALLGVSGNNRWVRAVETQAGGTTGATVWADFLLSHPRHSGVAV